MVQHTVHCGKQLRALLGSPSPIFFSRRTFRNEEVSGKKETQIIVDILMGEEDNQRISLLISKPSKLFSP